jgi:hypothetical protein
MTRDVFNKGFFMLLNGFSYAQKMPPTGQDVYWERLCYLSEGAFKYAVVKCLDNSKYFPTIAELKEIALTAPAPRPKLLDEPRPSPEQVERNHEALRSMISKLTRRKTMESGEQ